MGHLPCKFVHVKSVDRGYHFAANALIYLYSLLHKQLWIAYSSREPVKRPSSSPAPPSHSSNAINSLVRRARYCSFMTIFIVAYVHDKRKWT